MSDADATDLEEPAREAGKETASHSPAAALVCIRTCARPGRGWLVAHRRIIALAVSCAAALGLCGVTYAYRYYPVTQTDDAAAQAAVKAASEATVAILSYTPDTVDQDLAAAKSHMTGPLLQYVSGFDHYFLAPSVRRQNVKASAAVIRAAASNLELNSAVVLEFVHQTTSSKDKPEPVLTTNNIRITLTKVSGNWLVSKFEPE